MTIWSLGVKIGVHYQTYPVVNLERKWKQRMHQFFDLAIESLHLLILPNHLPVLTSLNYFLLVFKSWDHDEGSSQRYIEANHFDTQSWKTTFSFVLVRHERETQRNIPKELMLHNYRATSCILNTQLVLNIFWFV